MHEEDKSPLLQKDKNKTHLGPTPRETTPKSNLDPHEFEQVYGIQTTINSPFNERQESKESFVGEIGTPESPVKMEKLRSNYDIVNIYRVDNEQTTGNRIDNDQTTSSFKPLNETHATLE